MTSLTRLPRMLRWSGLSLLCACLAGSAPSPVASPVPSTAPHEMERAADLAQELAAVRRKPESTARKLEESRILYYLALAAPVETERRRIFGEGRELAAAVRALEPANPGGLLWWAAHEGEIADIERGFYGLGAIGKVRDALNELRAANPAYEHGGADCALGRLYQKAPGFISIGSSRKAEEHFKAALRIEPDHPGNQIFYAEFLLEEDELILARELALAVLASPKLAQSPIERNHWRAVARKIIEKTEKAAKSESGEKAK